MEIKVKFKDGMIETHRLPELAGNTSSYFDARANIEEGFNSLDAVVDVAERLELEDTGFFLSRFVISNEGGKIEEVRKSRYCVLPDFRLADAVCVLVDDEQVWENPDIARVRGMRSDLDW